MKPSARLRQIGDRINGLSIRERGLLLLVSFAVIFLIWDLFVMQPISQRQEQVQGQLQEVRDRVTALTGAIQEVATQRGVDPDARLHLRRQQLEEEIDELQASISNLHGGITAPRESISVLAGLLADQSGITIAELENLPTQPLLGPAGVPVPGIFVHRVRVIVESDFAGVGNYLDRISELPDGVFWESMDLTVPGWPDNRVELVLYSLAFSDNWLGV